MNHFFKQCAPMLAALSLPPMAAEAAHIIIGGFAGTGNGECVENVAPLAVPVWREEFGTRLEVSGTFYQTATGEASVVIRLFDDERPLTLAWHGAAGFQLLLPGGLPHNAPTTPTPSAPQTIAWRLRVHAPQNPAQRLVLETRQPDGAWQVVLERKAVLPGVREWVEEGGILTVGISGPLALGSDTHVRLFRDGVLLMVK